MRASLWLLLTLSLATLGACLGLTLALTPHRVDLLHAALFDVCSLRSRAIHWQNAERLPQPLRFDFTTSPNSVIVFELWIKDGPTLSFSQRLPHAC